MRRLTLIAALLGCGLPEVQQEGAHVLLAADPGLEMCGDGLAHMDRFVALLSAELGRPPPTGDDRITYHWLRALDFDARTVCVQEHGGCAFGGQVYMTNAPYDHELVHAVAWPDGVSAPFFIEGLAVAYEYRVPSRSFYEYYEGFASETIPESLASRDAAWLPGLQYPLAGAFTAFLIERVGVAAYMRVYRRLQVADTPGLVSRVLEQELGVSLDQLAEEFEITRRRCEPTAFQRKLIECSAPEIAWDGVTWASYRTLDCDQPDVVGPFGVDTIVVDHTIVVPEDATYALTVIGDAVTRDGEVANSVEITRCGGCEGFTEMGASTGQSATVALQSTTVAVLPAGLYSLRLHGPASVATGIGVRLERRWLVDENGLPRR